MTTMLASPPRSLAAAARVALDADRRRRLEQLDAFAAPWLEEKLLADGTFASAAQYQLAFDEFKKYVALILLSGGELAMTSRAVDAVWHQFILFTREYAAFCDRVLGRYLHHTPATSFTPVGDQSNARFFAWYEQTFGPPGETWDRSGTCDSCKDNAHR